MLRSTIESSIKGALGLLGVNEAANFKVEVPPRKELGDYASNVAIINAKTLKKAPLQIAKELVAEIEKLDQGKHFAKIEIVPPGFINFFLTDQAVEARLKEIVALDLDWGKSRHYQGRSILMEYVSANPTGPLHVGHGRWAVVGDCIARLFAAVGYKVEKEFYVNNVGNQVDKLYASVVASRAAANRSRKMVMAGRMLKRSKERRSARCSPLISTSKKRSWPRSGLNLTGSSLKMSFMTRTWCWPRLNN